MAEHPTSHPRHVLIVGAGPGIGTSFARLALHDGSDVTLSGRSRVKLEQVKAALNADSARVDTVVVDASDPVVLREALSDYASECEVPIDCALFNVSTWVSGGLESDLGAVADGLKTGVVSALAMAQAVVPRMRELPEARLLFTGGGTADSPMSAGIGLGLQKAALRNLAVALDKDLADTGIRVRTLTIRGSLAKDSPFDPDFVARALWDIADAAEVEKEFTGVGK